AERYERLIRDISGVQDGLPVFDLIFLGMGDDGHTLSLFPGTDAVNDDTSMTIAHHVPKLNADRVTFGKALANAAKKVVFLVGGASKAETLKRVDRKSTRLNSSHVKISYAVFCLKISKVSVLCKT